MDELVLLHLDNEVINTLNERGMVLSVCMLDDKGYVDLKWCLEISSPLLCFFDSLTQKQKLELDQKHNIETPMLAQQQPVVDQDQPPLDCYSRLNYIDSIITQAFDRFIDAKLFRTDWKKEDVERLTINSCLVDDDKFNQNLKCMKDATDETIFNSCLDLFFVTTWNKCLAFISHLILHKNYSP